MGVAEVIALLTALSNSAPPVAAMIIRLAQSMEGKSIAEIQGESDTLFDAVAARAKAELDALPPDA